MAELDLKGLSCPEPVMKVRKSLLSKPDETLCCVVDTRAAMENIKRLCSNMGYRVTVRGEAKIWKVEISR